MNHTALSPNEREPWKMPTRTQYSHSLLKEKAFKVSVSLSASIEGKKKKRTTFVIRFFFL
jgi:hypothetical protein